MRPLFVFTSQPLEVFVDLRIVHDTQDLEGKNIQLTCEAEC